MYENVVPLRVVYEKIKNMAVVHLRSHKKYNLLFVSETVCWSHTELTSIYTLYEYNHPSD
jgi:hypothetical protein